MRRQDWGKAFEHFDQQNPGFYEEFKRRALYHRKLGLNYLTAAFIFEEMRVYATVTTHIDRAMPEHLRDIRVNNNYRAPIVRKLIGEDPSFSDFFKTRRPAYKDPELA